MMYDWINNLPRAVGHTTAACGKSDRNPVIVTTTTRQAKQVEQDHGVEAMGLQQASTALQGRTSPVVFDLHAVQTLVNYYEGKLAEERRAVEERLGKIRDLTRPL